MDTPEAKYSISVTTEINTAIEVILRGDETYASILLYMIPSTKSELGGSLSLIDATVTITITG